MSCMFQKLKKRLLFVKQFCRESCVFFEFHSSVFYVKDLITKEVLLSGQSKDGLYVLLENSAMSMPQAFLSASLSTSADIWHRRLGHPSSRVLSFLASNKKVTCTSRPLNFQCPACPLGKSSRLSLGPIGHKTSAPLELVFSDVWGPAPILSSDDFCYFVIFVDAHTKFIWFYPLSAKSDVFNMFHQFQVLVERQFSCKIKSIQTDWGSEYRKLNSFFKTVGIHHRIIFPHTYERNGTVELCHRHIVETGLTLLGHYKASLKFWNYAFETSVYLINCMPTSVLQNKSPFETLFHQPPNYGFLRTFGCLCFLFLRPYNAHKLDYRSTPCVFLGYSSCYLSYRCLELSSNHIYISRHVRFHENSFPFIESTHVPATTNSNPQPAPISYLPALTSFPSSNPPQTPILSPHTSVPLPPYASMSLDHFAGSGSSAADITATASSPSATPPASPSQVPASSSQVPTESPPGLDLCIDLSSYSIPQQSPPIRSSDSLVAVASRQHPMVLRPRQHKSVNVSSVSASSMPPNSRVIYSSAHEPVSFREADRFVLAFCYGI